MCPEWNMTLLLMIVVHYFFYEKILVFIKITIITVN